MTYQKILENYSTYYVDLDGTLIDSENSIRYSFQVALDKLNITPLITVSNLNIGPTLRDNIDELIGRNLPEKSDLLRKTFIEIYDYSGWKDFKVYESIVEYLKLQSVRGKRLVLLTNKRTTPAIKILDKISIKEIFNDIYCIDSFDEEVKSKEDLLKMILNSKHKRRQVSILIGDTDSDSNAARFSGMDFLLFSKGQFKSHYKFSLE